MNLIEKIEEPTLKSESVRRWRMRASKVRILMNYLGGFGGKLKARRAKCSRLFSEFNPRNFWDEKKKVPPRDGNDFVSVLWRLRFALEQVGEMREGFEGRRFKLLAIR